MNSHHFQHSSAREAFPAPLRFTQGAIRQKDGSMEWRLWAPWADNVQLVIYRDEARTIQAMQPAGDYFVSRNNQAEEGLRYAYLLPDGKEYPDPASRWQPEGVHKPSAVFCPEQFFWTDDDWNGTPREELVIYELHVGTFTSQGTFDAIVSRLEDLKSLGVTAIEIMPVAQFAGDRNWGYDGVYPYAVQHSYGGPRGLQRLVNSAHEYGINVILDVVYNHLGPEGNYLGKFGPYFTDRYHTPWGDAVNYDGADSDIVRKFIIDNACMWVRDFHIDGLRLDAIHAIYDFGARHVLSELQEAVQEIADRQSRFVHVIAETNQNDPSLIDPVERNGLGLGAVWSDDFHHSLHTSLTDDRDGYYRDYGQPEHLTKAFEEVFVYDGCYSPYRRRHHGAPVAKRDRNRFVICFHNHDQIGNRALGDRPSTRISEAAQRLACGLLMISPNIPLLFMGEEYGERNPFPFFCSFGDEELVEAVRNGRRKEFEDLEFDWGEEIPDPQSATTFESARLTWNWPAGTLHACLRQLHRDLLNARRTWPPLRDRQNTSARVMRLQSTNSSSRNACLIVVERGWEPILTAVANLSSTEQAIPREFLQGQSAIFSTEMTLYGGERDISRPATVLYSHELLIFGDKEWKDE